MKRRPLVPILAAALILAAAFALAPSAGLASGDPEKPKPRTRELLTTDDHTLKLELPGLQSVKLARDPQTGEVWYIVATDEQGKQEYTPQEFAELLVKYRPTKSWWQRLMNVSSWVGVVWVFVGLIGQILFTGRMIVQWIVSEKRGESIVPPAFWWMSLIGASMLLAYFTWRKDIVGFIGQATGWLIYIRNIYLIYYKPRRFPVIPTGGTALLDPRDPDIQAEGKS